MKYTLSSAFYHLIIKPSITLTDDIFSYFWQLDTVYLRIVEIIIFHEFFFLFYTSF